MRDNHRSLILQLKRRLFVRAVRDAGTSGLWD
jgi:hypothetical protein